MSNILTIGDLFRKFVEMQVSPFIGDYEFLSVIRENEVLFNSFVIRKYDNIISCFETGTTIGTIQADINIFNYVNTNFFNSLLNALNGLDIIGEFDELTEVLKNYGLDKTEVGYGVDIITDILGANRVVTGTSGLVIDTQYKQGVGSNNFAPSDKMEHGFSDYEIESNSDQTTNTKTRGSRTDTTERKAREDGETIKKINGGKERIISGEVNLFGKYFMDIYANKLVSYLGIGVYRG